MKNEATREFMRRQCENCWHMKSNHLGVSRIEPGHSIEKMTTGCRLQTCNCPGFEEADEYTKEECEKLYIEWKELENKTSLRVETLKRGGKYSAQLAPAASDLQRSAEARRELYRKCSAVLDFDPSDWHKIEKGELI